MKQEVFQELDINRILIPAIDEASFLVMEGEVSPEDIDEFMKLGANYPISPLALADMVGIDVCLSVMEVLYNDFSDSKYRPCTLSEKMARGGFLDRKICRGFNKYEVS